MVWRLPIWFLVFRWIYAGQQREPFAILREELSLLPIRGLGTATESWLDYWRLPKRWDSMGSCNTMCYQSVDYLCAWKYGADNDVVSKRRWRVLLE